MRDYLANINVEDLVLLKINELGAVSEYQTSTVFCDEQEREVMGQGVDEAYWKPSADLGDGVNDVTVYAEVRG